jgi:hypothetical protein
MSAAIRRASSLVSSQLGCCSSSRLILKIDIGELLAVVVAHDEASILFFVFSTCSKVWPSRKPSGAVQVDSPPMTIR